jgi:RimJ/RimL family protein N-acetyltransferase
VTATPEERGRRVRLTALREEDSDQLFAWINDHELVVRSAPWRPVARADHDAWFAAIRGRDDARIFAIRLIEGDQLIGSCQLHSIVPERGSAELQIRIGERHEQGLGYGREAVELLLRHAFDSLGLERVTLQVFASNAPALAVYRATGFREEPGPPEEVAIDGRRERVLQMTIAAPGRSRLVAIHQPNFFPWLGFFDKLRRCDTFVLLDTVEFSKGSRINRSQVLVGGRPHWITAPVRRSGIGGPIRDMLIEEGRDWRSNVVRTLRQSYSRAPGTAVAMPLLEELIGFPTERLTDFNEQAIRRLAHELGLTRAAIVRASDLAVEGRATRLLVDIVRAVGGTAYLAGGGAGGYQEDELFDESGIELVHQRFVPPLYPQPVDEPVPGLSVIDALMQCGPDGARALLSREAHAAPS